MSTPSEAYRWPPARRLIVSVLLTLHLTAVFSAPWSTPPSSDLARSLGTLMFPYLKLVGIAYHGYRFFAPDPGPSHLIRYEIAWEDGTTQSWEFPDPDRHWPRLWYHRHFMLAETLAADYGQAQALPPRETIPPDELPFIQTDLRRAELLKKSVAKCLLGQHPGAERIRMFVRTHHLPTPQDIASGLALNDERLYEEFPLAEYARDDL